MAAQGHDESVMMHLVSSNASDDLARMMSRTSNEALLKVWNIALGIVKIDSRGENEGLCRFVSQNCSQL